MSDPYSPATAEGEDAATLWFERSLFNGEYLAAVAYGLHLAVFGISAYFLTRGAATAKAKISWGFLGYIVLLLACGTINLASGIKFAELAWIDSRDFPGGPAAFNVQMYSDMVETLGNGSYIVANFLAGGLLLWRCFVVYGGNYWVIVLPALVFLASTALSILTIYQAAQPTASLWSNSAVVVAVPYWSISIAYNILASMMIAGRLLWHRRSLRKVMGPEHGAMYSGIAAMFIESAAMYSITGLIFIICFARTSNVGNLILGILSQVECMAPELIILRVALGSAWTPKTSKETHISPHMSFKSNSNAHSKESGAMVTIFGPIGTEQSSTEPSNSSFTASNSKANQVLGSV